MYDLDPARMRAADAASRQASEKKLDISPRVCYTVREKYEPRLYMVEWFVKMVEERRGKTSDPAKKSW